MNVPNYRSALWIININTHSGCFARQCIRAGTIKYLNATKQTSMHEEICRESKVEFLSDTPHKLYYQLNSQNDQYRFDAGIDHYRKYQWSENEQNWRNISRLSMVLYNVARPTKRLCHRDSSTFFVRIFSVVLTINSGKKDEGKKKGEWYRDAFKFAI